LGVEKKSWIQDCVPKKTNDWNNDEKKFFKNLFSR
jgi:hypothetical protein